MHIFIITFTVCFKAMLYLVNWMPQERTVGIMARNHFSNLMLDDVDEKCYAGDFSQLINSSILHFANMYNFVFVLYCAIQCTYVVCTLANLGLSQERRKGPLGEKGREMDCGRHDVLGRQNKGAFCCGKRQWNMCVCVRCPPIHLSVWLSSVSVPMSCV